MSNQFEASNNLQQGPIQIRARVQIQMRQEATRLQIFHPEQLQFRNKLKDNNKFKDHSNLPHEAIPLLLRTERSLKTQTIHLQEDKHLKSIQLSIT